jgi:hypothetical protein
MNGLATFFPILLGSLVVCAFATPFLLFELEDRRKERKAKAAKRSE